MGHFPRLGQPADGLGATLDFAWLIAVGSLAYPVAGHGLQERLVGGVGSVGQRQHAAKGVQRLQRASEADLPRLQLVRLRGTVSVEHSIARLTAEKLWRYLNEKPFVNALGALTGNQAMQQVRAGLDAIYLSGWQVAGDANLSGQMYPDQSLYPADSVPAVVRRPRPTKSALPTTMAGARSPTSR